MLKEGVPGLDRIEEPRPRSPAAASSTMHLVTHVRRQEIMPILEWQALKRAHLTMSQIL